MTISQVIIQSGLLDSNSKITRAIQQKALKVNGVVPDSPFENIELGDFLNGFWIGGFKELCEQEGTNQILVLKFGKSGRIVKIIDNQLKIVA